MELRKTFSDFYERGEVKIKKVYCSCKEGEFPPKAGVRLGRTSPPRHAVTICVMNESLKIEKREYVPNHFEPVTIPKNYAVIWRAIINDGKQGVSGFEDILSGERLGDGMQNNNPGGVYQLAFALSIATNEKVVEICKSTRLDSGEIMRELRKMGALSGMKIIDLGCGKAYFARAAATLGAEVYTADSKDLSPSEKATLKGHTVIDLNEPNSLEVLKRETRGDFDLVTEWIMAPLGGDDPRLNAPKKETILKIGAGLLKRGGYLFQELVRSQPLRKK